MHYNYLKTFCFLILTVSQFACKRNKIQKSISEIPKKEDVVSIPDSTQNLVITPKRELELQESDFEHLKLKTKIDFRSPVFNQSFPANIHIRKDSIIWISVSLGIEAARAKITPDSIFFMDRINKKYYNMSLNELSRQFNFDLNFNLFQSLLVGNLPIPYSDSDSLSFNSLYTSIFQVKNDIRIENQIDNLNHKLSTILAQNKNGKSKLGISYSSYTEANGFVVPQLILAKIDESKSGELKTSTLNLEHAKFDFADHDLRYPYNIPKSYEKGIIEF